jgi:glutamate carboxypeptidase
MDIKAFLKELVETESPSHDKAAVDRVGAMIAGKSRDLGAQVKRISNQGTGDHIQADFALSGMSRQANAAEAQNGILLLCHMDTVFPIGTLEKMPYYEADGKIFGPGVLDMKAGIAICLSALAEFQNSDERKRPVTLLCTSDEEIGSGTSRKYIEALAKESALVLVFEPALPDGSLKTWRKGNGGFDIQVKGRAAHSGGDHQQGRNAIEEMAHQVIAIQKLTDYSRQTTLNVGVIQGGTVSNVVPDHAAAEVDVRFIEQREWERIESEMQNLKPVLNGTSLQITGGVNRPPMPFDDTMKATFEKAQSIASGIGMELKAGGTGGVSDANFVASLGIPVLDGMGAVGEGYHSEREFIVAASLEEKRKLLMELIRQW